MKLVVVVCALSFSAIVLIPSSSAVSGEIVVNVISDDSDINPGDGICQTDINEHCSLRAAIEEANSAVDLNTITFGIDNTNYSTMTIVLNSDLPAITNALVIDGYTNNFEAKENLEISPQAITSKLNIEIDARAAVTSVLNVQANSAEIHGISIFNCPLSGCINVDGDSVKILGNYVGLKANGEVASNSESKTGINITGSLSQIGGLLPKERNIISNNSNTQINISGGTATKVQGNIIGAKPDGTVSKEFNNGKGVTLDGLVSNALIGGTEVGQGNVFRGLTDSAILVLEKEYKNENYIATPTQNTILGNSISAINISGKTPSVGTSSIDFLHGIDISNPSDFVLDEFWKIDPIDSSKYLYPPKVNSALFQPENILNVSIDVNSMESTSGLYRIEFFLQHKSTKQLDNAGEIFIGSINTKNGSNISGTINLTNISSLEGVNLNEFLVTATITPHDVTSFSQYGATSKFSKAVNIK